jgi:nucleoside 2-deoxyribosyltransferase
VSGPLRLYVAGRFQSYAKVRAVADACVKAGHTITHDWTRTPEFGSDGHPLHADGAQAKAALRGFAEADIAGVRAADCVVLCADDSLAGAWVEMGIALERGTPVVAVAHERWTIFLECAGVRCIDSYSELQTALAEVGRSERQGAGRYVAAVDEEPS